MRRSLHILSTIMVIVLNATFSSYAQDTEGAVNLLKEFNKKHSTLTRQTTAQTRGLKSASETTTTYTYEVTETSNDASVENSLPWAIAQVNAITDETASADIDIHTDITLTNALDIKTKVVSLTIFGYFHTISVEEPGVSAYRLFNIGNCMNVLFINLDFQGGNIPTVNAWLIGTGGAFTIKKSSVWFDGCDFYNSKTDGYGGVAFIYNNSSVSFYGCDFEDNTAGIAGNNVYCNRSYTIFTRCNITSDTKSAPTTKSIRATETDNLGIANFEFSNSIVSMDSSDINSMRMGSDYSQLPDSMVSDIGFYEGYDVLFSATNSNIETLNAVNEISSGLKQLVYYGAAITYDENDSIISSVPSVVNNDNFNIDTSDVELVVDTITLNSEAFNVNLGSLSIIEMPEEFYEEGTATSELKSTKLASSDPVINVSTISVNGADFNVDFPVSMLTDEIVLNDLGDSLSVLNIGNGATIGQTETGSASGSSLITANGSSTVTIATSTTLEIPANGTAISNSETATVDVDESVVIVTGISNTTTTMDVTVFSPYDNIVRVIAGKNINRYVVTSITGQVVDNKSIAPTSEFDINISTLKSGISILTLFGEDQSVTSTKILIK